MEDFKPTLKQKALHSAWSFFPWIIIAIIIFFIIGMCGAISFKKNKLEAEKTAAMKQEASIANITTLTVNPGRLADKIDLPAEVEPWEDVWVKAEVPGQVVSVIAREGQKIVEGQIIVQLDDRDYRSRLDRIQANLQFAKANHGRIAELAKQHIVSASQLEETEARLKDMETQAQEAELALKRTHVRAPISCVLNKIKAKRGDFLGVGDPVAQIIQLDRIKVKVGVPESDVAAIFDLQQADVIFEALNKRRVVGKKVFLSRQPDSLSRLYDLELFIANPAGDILPGMFARVELVKHVYDKALAVPLFSVITDKNERFVYIEKNGKAERRNVQLGTLVGLLVHITSGLQPGDKVVVTGQRQINAGQSVVVIKNFSGIEELPTTL
jgi:RND family efflux transporter MFP subunit